MENEEAAAAPPEGDIAKEAGEEEATQENAAESEEKNEVNQAEEEPKEAAGINYSE